MWTLWFKGTKDMLLRLLLRPQPSPPLTQKSTPVAASASGGGTTTDSATDDCDSTRDVDTGMDGAGGGDSPRDSYV